MDIRVVEDFFKVLGCVALVFCGFLVVVGVILGFLAHAYLK